MHSTIFERNPPAALRGRRVARPRGPYEVEAEHAQRLGFTLAQFQPVDMVSNTYVLRHGDQELLRTSHIYHVKLWLDGAQHERSYPQPQHPAP